MDTILICCAALRRYDTFFPATVTQEGANTIRKQRKLMCDLILIINISEVIACEMKAIMHIFLFFCYLLAQSHLAKLVLFSFLNKLNPNV